MNRRVNPSRRWLWPACWLLAACTLSAQPSEPGFDSEGALRVQDKRNDRVKVHAHSQYRERWDLSDLPPYVPQEKVSGTLHIWGSNYVKDGKLSTYWEEDFRRFQPAVRFSWQLDGGDMGTVGLTSDLADIGILNEIKYSEELGFERRHSYPPTEFLVMTGAFDVPGWSPPICIVVNAENPLSHLSIEQLDGIFGGQRNGGWIKTSWHQEFARGPELNIRSWDGAGLTGEWAGKPIHPYAYTFRYHAMTAFSDKVLKGSDQWNENTKLFANYLAADGSWQGEADQVLNAVKQDKYGIGIILYRKLIPGTKMIALSRGQGPAVELNLQNTRSRRYPLVGENYFYVNHRPGTAWDPKVREFVRYVLSREGQDAIQRDAKFLPLTGDVVKAQLAKLGQ